LVDVSVIIPTYRRPVELMQALASVLCQKGVTTEVLVVDDSPEGLAETAVNSIGDGRVTYMRNPVPSGGLPSVVRNLAWPHARGAFVHFLDDDDLVPEGHYAAVKQAFDCGSEVGVVFGRIEPFGEVTADVEHERRYFEDARRRAVACKLFGRRWGFTARMFFDATLLVCSAAVVRRECISAIGGFDPALRVNEDVDFYARVIRRFGARFMDRVCVHRRVGPSLIHQPNVDRLLEESYSHIHANYRATWGAAEFLAMKGFARTVLKVT
jgi:glycosyltransferase involved in cell wall biosynthesis